MRGISWLFLLFSIAFSSCKKENAFVYRGPHDISIMSFNLRYSNEGDGKNKWDNRKDACIRMLQEHKPSIIGIQEGLQEQVDFLDQMLPAYKYVGEINEHGPFGEYKAIFYNQHDFELIKSETFWLSPTPNVPSKGWDANNVRIVTWAHLKDLKHQKSIYVFNTHFDHKGKTSRKESAKLLVQKIHEIVPTNTAVFITGDFNALIRDAIFDPILEEFYCARRFSAFTDNINSFNAFGRWYLSRNIDFIFYRQAEALAFKTLVKNYGVPYISDHYPLLTHFNYK